MERQKALIERTEAALGAPVTQDRIVTDLRRLGVREGDVLLAHTSLSSAGWICGGAETLIRALIEALGEGGTLVMPAHSANYSEPDGWEAPPAPKGWRGVIRETMPGWDPLLTPTWGIGRVPELFRHFPAARRSVHPLHSFAALGARADAITANHALEDGLGEGSPLGRLYELRGRALLIGCGHGANTSMRLAEHRAEWPGKKRILQGAPIMDENGRRVWRRFKQLDYDEEDFEQCGRAFESAVKGAAMGDALVSGRVGLAECRLMSQPILVDFAAGWLSRHRASGEDSHQANFA